MLPEVVVGGGPEIGTPLLEAAEGEDVEVADGVTVEGGSSEDSVVGNDDEAVEEEDPLCACNA